MTLTQTAQFTKTAALILVVLLVVGISGWLSFDFYYNHYILPAKQAAANAPDVKFGILPPPPLPQSTVTSSNYSYSLDTDTGSLPTNLPAVGKVYFIPQLGPTLLAPAKAKELAQKFGFTSDPVGLNDTTDKFTNESGDNLTIDLNSSNFNFQKTSTPSATTNLSDEGSLLTDFRGFLSQKGLLKNSLQKGRGKVYYDKFPTKESTTATITLWPEDLDSLHIVTPTFRNGLIQAMIIASENLSERFQKLDFYYWEPDLQNMATYPLRSVSEAFTDLKSGNGVIIVQPSAAQTSINTVYLAYFESVTYAKYIQPVYVFEGENFVAYIPAIAKKYLKATP